MSKHDAMKIQGCVLRLNIHCDGCKQKVYKILHKIHGVNTVKIDAEEGKVSVRGNNIDPTKLINKLEKSGKHAELWNNNNNNIMNNFNNNIHFQNVKPKHHHNNNNMNNIQQQQLKASNNNKSVHFNLPHDDSDFSDDEFSHGHGHGLQKNAIMPIPMAGYGPNGPFRPNRPNAMNGKKGGDVKKGEVIDFPVRMKGKKDGGGGGGGGGTKSKGKGGDKKKGGGFLGLGKKGLFGFGGRKSKKDHKSGKSDGAKQQEIGFHDIDIPKPNKGSKGSSGNGKNMREMGQEGHGNGKRGPMGQMGPPMGNYIQAVQGLPGQQMMNQGMGQGGNPYNQQQQQQQQQYMAMMMMNQQRGVGNDMFQPMMYSRPNPAVNYAPPPPMFPPIATDQYTHIFSDENTDSCSIM